MAYLKNTFQTDLETFDLILVDEGQDLSPVMLNALMHCTKRIVLVGDTHQRIYGFRHAIDAMSILSSDQTFDLTLSFRFGEPVAALAERFIVEAKKEYNFKIRGNRSRKSAVSFYHDLSAMKNGEGTAILSRTNLGLFRKAMFLRAKRWPYHFERDLTGDLLRTLDIYRLYCGEADRIRDPWIKSFDSIEYLDQYAEQSQDFQLSNLSQFVKQNAAEFPGAIFEMIDLVGKNGDQKDCGAVILSTVHTAKGQQYRQVIIDEDVAEAIGRTTGKDAKQFQEEVNVAYVCVTRVKEHLWLPEAMKTILTPAWQSYMSSIAPPSTAPQKTTPKPVLAERAPSEVKSPPRRSKGASVPYRGYWSSSHKSRPSSRQPVRPARSKYKIGERVKTSNGYGTIIDIVGEQYVIALEGQVAKMRENIVALNLYNH